MKVRALRGVCIGVDRNLKPGDTADLEAAQVEFLANIGAVELAPDEPVAQDPLLFAADEPGGVESESSQDTHSETIAPAKKSGKKEK